MVLSLLFFTETRYLSLKFGKFWKIQKNEKTLALNSNPHTCPSGNESSAWDHSAKLNWYFEWAKLIVIVILQVHGFFSFIHRVIALYFKFLHCAIHPDTMYVNVMHKWVWRYYNLKGKGAHDNNVSWIVILNDQSIFFRASSAQCSLYFCKDMSARPNDSKDYNNFHFPKA